MTVNTLRDSTVKPYGINGYKLFQSDCTAFILINKMFNLRERKKKPFVNGFPAKY